MSDSKFEKMMDEIASIIIKYGYKNLGWQQTLDHRDLMRFVRGKIRLDMIAYETEVDYENRE